MLRPALPFRKGSVVINPALAFKPEGAIESGWGSPKRAVPRVTMLELSTRSSTGTRIGEGVGGAVRAATSAGDSIREPASQPPTAAIVANAKIEIRAVIRCLLIIRTYAAGHDREACLFARDLSLNKTISKSSRSCDGSAQDIDGPALLI